MISTSLAIKLHTTFDSDLLRVCLFMLIIFQIPLYMDGHFTWRTCIQPYARTHYTMTLWAECRRDKTAGRGEQACHPHSSSPFVPIASPKERDFLFQIFALVAMGNKGFWMWTWVKVDCCLSRFSSSSKLPKGLAVGNFTLMLVQNARYLPDSVLVFNLFLEGKKRISFNDI